MQWWGGYFAPIPSSKPSDNFTLSIYAANGTVPGALMMSLALGAADSAADDGTAPGVVFRYQDSFDLIQLTAGDYFIALSNDDSNAESDWGWVATSSGLGGAQFNQPAQSWFGFSEVNLAFNLQNNVPEPASLLLVVSALSALAIARRRKQERG